MQHARTRSLTILATSACPFRHGHKKRLTRFQDRQTPVDLVFHHEDNLTKTLSDSAQTQKMRNGNLLGETHLGESKSNEGSARRIGYMLP